MLNRIALVCAGGLAAACSSSGGNRTDGGVMDLRPACVPSGAEVCDGRDNDCNGMVDEGLTAATANPHQFVATVVSLPRNKDEFAYDVNGDGKPDNQLGNVVQILTFQMFDAN